MDRPFLFLKRHGKRYHAFKTVPIFASLDDKLKRAIVRPNLLQGRGNARQPRVREPLLSHAQVLSGFCNL